MFRLLSFYFQMMSSLSFVPFIYRSSAPLRVHRCNHRQYYTIYGAIRGEVCTSVLFHSNGFFRLWDHLVACEFSWKSADCCLWHYFTRLLWEVFPEVDSVLFSDGSLRTLLAFGLRLPGCFVRYCWKLLIIMECFRRFSLCTSIAFEFSCPGCFVRYYWKSILEL